METEIRDERKWNEKLRKMGLFPRIFSTVELPDGNCESDIKSTFLAAQNQLYLPHSLDVSVFSAKEKAFEEHEDGCKIVNETSYSEPETSYCNSLTAKTYYGTEDWSECVVNKEKLDFENTGQGSRERLSKLLGRLRCLRGDVIKNGSEKVGACLEETTEIAVHEDSSMEKIINLVELEVEELHFEWKTGATLKSDKINSLEKANQLLSEHLTNARVVQNCLRAELEYAQKQNHDLHDVIINFASVIGKSPADLVNTCGYEAGSERAVPVINTTPLTDYPAPNAELELILKTGKTVGESSAFSSKIRDFLENVYDFPHKEEIPRAKNPGERIVSRNLIIPRKLSSANFQKREHEFDSIMNCLKARGSVVDSLNTQMEKYDADFLTLQGEIYEVAAEKVELSKAYQDLVEKHNALLEERHNFDRILRLIADEKQSTQASINSIFTTVLNKLNALEKDEKTYFHRVSAFESATQLLEEQAEIYRHEIQALKTTISEKDKEYQLDKAELGSHLRAVEAESKEVKLRLETEVKEAEAQVERKWEEQLKEMKLVEEKLMTEKEELRKALAEMESALGMARNDVDELEKMNLILKNASADYQLSNEKLMKDSEEFKKKVELLESRVKELKGHLKEQRARWSKRVKEEEEETRLVRERCGWLENQIEHLNYQLRESHHRVQTYQEEKTSLAQQVMAAEEERKLVDRKLEELKGALTGDAKLREALMERNSVLQGEIDRLRKAKLVGGHPHNLLTQNNLVGGNTEELNERKEDIIERIQNQNLRFESELGEKGENPKDKEGTEKRSSVSLHRVNAPSWPRSSILSKCGSKVENMGGFLLAPDQVQVAGRFRNCDSRQQTYAFVHEEKY